MTFDWFGENAEPMKFHVTLFFPHLLVELLPTDWNHHGIVAGFNI